MRYNADSPADPRRRLSVESVGIYGLVAAVVVLGWQMTIQPLKQRAPVEAAIRLAPTSPLVLRRAAESELAAGRIENAAVLSREALVRSPFDVRALRVLGLTEARAGRDDDADDLLTLAGNWSLRDDPAHAWLVERRLRDGNYVSAFAHADTLVRRRQDIQPQVFRLFTIAGTEDPQRSLPVIASLLSARPPWRDAYLVSLYQTAQGLSLAATLGIMLELSGGPLTTGELEGLYWNLLNKGQLEALSTVRTRIGRPPLGAAVTNGGFTDAAAPMPFQWRLYQSAGIAAEIVADDLKPSNSALRVDYNGYATGTIAEQLMSLAPGTYRFSSNVRTESGDPGARLAWTVECAAGGGTLVSILPGKSANGLHAWTVLSGQLEVPEGCPAQWLRLKTRAGDRRSSMVVWFDQVDISSTSGTTGTPPMGAPNG